MRLHVNDRVGPKAASFSEMKVKLQTDAALDLDLWRRIPSSSSELQKKQDVTKMHLHVVPYPGTVLRPYLNSWSRSPQITLLPPPVFTHPDVEVFLHRSTDPLGSPRVTVAIFSQRIV